MSSCEGHWPLAVNLLQAMIRDEDLRVVKLDVRRKAERQQKQETPVWFDVKRDANWKPTLKMSGVLSVYQSGAHTKCIREMRLSSQVLPNVVTYNGARSLAYGCQAYVPYTECPWESVGQSKAVSSTAFPTYFMSFSFLYTNKKKHAFSLHQVWAVGG